MIATGWGQLTLDLDKPALLNNVFHLLALLDLSLSFLLHLGDLIGSVVHAILALGPERHASNEMCRNIFKWFIPLADALTRCQEIDAELGHAAAWILCCRGIFYGIDMEWDWTTHDWEQDTGALLIDDDHHILDLGRQLVRLLVRLETLEFLLLGSIQLAGAFTVGFEAFALLLLV